MAISDVRLQNFRSYRDSSFEFDDGVNIIVGPNASGKTNLLEAVLLLCRGKSYRASDGDMVRFDQTWARIDAHFKDSIRTITIKTELGRPDKNIKIDGTNLKRMSFERTLPVVVFEPENLQLLTRSPGTRRDFIDDIIAQVVPTYTSTLSHYKRALTQRNTLLKQDKPEDQLFVWDLRLSELGGSIMQARQAFISDNSQRLTELYSEIAGKKYAANLTYSSKITASEPTSQLLKALQSHASLDKQRGFTSFGPHRDDIVPVLGGHELALAGSRGETRTMLLALKLLEMEVLESARGKKPLLLLDDVFSELDGARRKALTNYLKDHQTFITTTDADIVTKNFTQSAHLIALA